MVGGLLGDARQTVHQGVVGQGRVLRDALGELNRLGQRLASWHVVLRHANAHAFSGLVHPAGEHHVHHAVGADELGYPHRTATTDKNAA